MAETITNVEYNPDENSDSKGYKNNGIGNNESIVPDLILTLQWGLVNSVVIILG